MNLEPTETTEEEQLMHTVFMHTVFMHTVFMHTMFPHPTLAEMMKEAVLDAHGRVLNV